MKLVRPYAAGIWFRVALLITLAQLFLSICKDEWFPGDFLLCCGMLAGTAAWALAERLQRLRDHRRRRRRWICVRCGYDLRASPERCPECGTPIARRG